MRKISYTVNVAAPPHVERVEVGGVAYYGRVTYGKCAVLYRFGRPVTWFVLTARQQQKVRQGRGRINVTEKSIARARDLCR